MKRVFNSFKEIVSSFYDNENHQLLVIWCDTMRSGVYFDPQNAPFDLNLSKEGFLNRQISTLNKWFESGCQITTVYLMNKKTFYRTYLNISVPFYTLNELTSFLDKILSKRELETL